MPRVDSNRRALGACHSFACFQSQREVYIWCQRLWCMHCMLQFHRRTSLIGSLWNIFMKPHTTIVILTACAVIAVLLPSANGTWSTAQLSQARYELAAASVGNMSLFALGYTGSALVSYEC